MYDIELIRKYKTVKAGQLVEDEIKLIQDSNPYELLVDGELMRYREKNFKFDTEKNRKSFRGLGFDIKEKREHIIQRHLFYARSKYEKELGKIIGYEVPTVYETTNKTVIDLLSYNNNELWLIELKDCELLGIDTGNVEDEYPERAIYEISTYYSFLKNEIKNNDKFVKALGKVLPDVDIRKLNIKMVLLVSKTMAKECLKLPHPNIEVMSIEAKEKLNGHIIDEQKQLFKIEKVNKCHTLP